MAASDQIVFFQRKDHVKQGSQHIVGVKFRDRESALLVTPTNISYRIDDLTTGATVLDWTSVSADDEIEITVTPTQNAMQDECHDREVRQLVVAADYGLATQYLDSVEFVVENVWNVT
jgi:hypothetical protein